MATPFRLGLLMLAAVAATFQFNQLGTDRIGHLLEFVHAKMTGIDLEIDTGHAGDPEPWGFGSVFHFLPFTIKNLSVHDRLLWKGVMEMKCINN
jgi:hypothetical protein